MLEEAVAVIRVLWKGEQHSHYGDHYTVENARLYTTPESPPPIIVSAFGSKSVELAARIGDGTGEHRARTGPPRRVRRRGRTRQAEARADQGLLGADRT